MIKLVKNDYFIYCKEARIESNRSFYGSFSLGPFDAGQSITIANALRRTLLSELKGLAITSAEIEGAFHEYSTLPGVRESILDILLNLKDIVLKAINYGNKKRAMSLAATFKNEQIGYLKTRGPGIVTASELKLPPGIQCVDPDQYIATLSEEGILNIKFNINEGTNYVIQNTPPSATSDPPLSFKMGGEKKGIIETRNKESGLRRLWLKKVKAIKSRLKYNSGFNPLFPLWGKGGLKARNGLCLFFLKKQIKASNKSSLLLSKGSLSLTPFTPILPPSSTPPLPLQSNSLKKNLKSLQPLEGFLKTGVNGGEKVEIKGGSKVLEAANRVKKKKALPYKGLLEKTLSEERGLLGQASAITKKRHDRLLKQKTNLPLLKQRSIGVSKAFGASFLKRGSAPFSSSFFSFKKYGAPAPPPLAIDAVFMPVNKVNYIIEINEQSVISKDKNYKTLDPPLSTSRNSLFYKAAQKRALKAEPLIKGKASKTFLEVRHNKKPWLKTSLTKAPFFLLLNVLLWKQAFKKREPFFTQFLFLKTNKSQNWLGTPFPFSQKSPFNSRLKQKKVRFYAKNYFMLYGDNRQDLKSMPESGNATQPLNVSKQQSTLEAIKTGFCPKKKKKQGLATDRPHHQPFEMFKTINSNILGSGFLNINTRSLLSPLYLSLFPSNPFYSFGGGPKGEMRGVKGNNGKEKKTVDKEKLVFFPLASLAPLKQKKRIFSFARLCLGARKTFFVSFFPFHYSKGYLQNGFLKKGWAATPLQKNSFFFKGALAEDKEKINKTSLTFASKRSLPLPCVYFSVNGHPGGEGRAFKKRFPFFKLHPALLKNKMGAPSKKNSVFFEGRGWGVLLNKSSAFMRSNTLPHLRGSILKRSNNPFQAALQFRSKERKKNSDLESNIRPPLAQYNFARVASLPSIPLPLTPLSCFARGRRGTRSNRGGDQDGPISVNSNVFDSFNGRNHVEKRIKPMRLSDYQTKTSIKNNIILEIWTNGSIHPRQALYDGLKNLLSTFSKLEKAKFIRSIFQSEKTYDNIALSPILKSNFSLISLEKKK